MSYITTRIVKTDKCGKNPQSASRKPNYHTTCGKNCHKSLSVYCSSNLSINVIFTVSIEIIIVHTAKCSGTHRNFSSAAMNCPNFIFCVWNRQKQRSFPACGAAVKFHFIVVRRAAQKPPERGSVPGPRGGGASPVPPDGASASWTPSPLSATSSLLR